MSHPRRRYDEFHGSQARPLATCPECGKRAYTTRKTAKRGARALYPGETMRVYNCPGTPWWHMTSQDAVRSAAERRLHAPASDDAP